MPQYWLMKTEPSVYSFDDLVREGQTCWEGVRNYTARNHMRAMAAGDQVFFYHSQVKPPGIVGVAKVVREAYPDHFAFDSDSQYHDPKSTPDAPRWFMVDLAPVRALPHPVGLPDLKANPRLAAMAVVQRGQRLSVQPVTADEFREVLRMAEGGSGS